MKLLISLLGLIGSVLLFTPTILVGAANDDHLRGLKWEHVVTAGGKDSYPNPGFEDQATFLLNVNAKVDSEGNANGRVTWKFLDGRFASFSNNIYCMLVEENRAYLVYEAEGGEFSSYGVPGNYVLLALKDNGEGFNSEPDEQSYIYVAGGPIPCEDWKNFIDTSLFGAGFPVKWFHGNVQVN